MTTSPLLGTPHRRVGLAAVTAFAVLALLLALPKGGGTPAAAQPALQAPAASPVPASPTVPADPTVPGADRRSWRGGFDPDDRYGGGFHDGRGAPDGGPPDGGSGGGGGLPGGGVDPGATPDDGGATPAPSTGATTGQTT